MNNPLSVCLLLLASAARAAGLDDCRAADLSGQFPDAATRDQCSVGSCHAFGSVGVLEAALFRATGKKTRLSEADLFVSKIVTDKAYYARFSESMTKLRNGEPLLGDIASVQEGAFVEDDLPFAIEHGLATGDTVGYESMFTRYRAYREAEKKNMLGELEREFKWRQNATGLEIFLSDFMNSKYEDLATNESSRRHLERALLGGPDVMKKIYAERAANKRAMTGFLVVNEDFKHVTPESPTAQDAAKCLAAGKRASQWIRLQLCNAKPRPVAVSMLLGGLPAWGQTSTSEHAAHAFVIQGFKTEADGTRTFITRNSWGGLNPDVPESQMCRVYRAATVVTPSDRATAKAK